MASQIFTAGCLFSAIALTNSWVMNVCELPWPVWTRNGAGQSLEMIRLRVGFDRYIAFGIAVAVHHRLAVFRDAHHCIGRMFRALHDVGHAVAEELAAFGAARSHMPENRDAAGVSARSLEKSRGVPERIFVGIGRENFVA